MTPTTTTTQGVTLDELIEYQRQLLENYQPNPVVELIARNILASLIRLREIEGKLREPSEEMRFIGNVTQAEQEGGNMRSATDIFRAMSAILLRGKP